MEEALVETGAFGSEINFLGLLLWFVGAALLIVLIGMAIRNWRLRRLCDPRKDHYPPPESGPRRYRQGV